MTVQRHQNLVGNVRRGHASPLFIDIHSERFVDLLRDPGAAKMVFTTFQLDDGFYGDQGVRVLESQRFGRASNLNIHFHMRTASGGTGPEPPRSRPRGITT